MRRRFGAAAIGIMWALAPRPAAAGADAGCAVAELAAALDFRLPIGTAARAAWLLDEALGVAPAAVYPLDPASVASNCRPSNGLSEGAALDSDGDTVAFASFASNLAAGDGISFDVFVRDLAACTTELASGGLGGAAPDGVSANPAIDRAGRYVAFDSTAANLVAGDTNRTTCPPPPIGDNCVAEGRDVFVRDRVAGVTVRVSLSTAGVQGVGNAASTAIDADGRHVAFAAGMTGLVPGKATKVADVFVRDRDVDGNGLYDEPGGVATVLVSTNAAGDAALYPPIPIGSVRPALGANGRHVAFDSDATNLVAGDTNGQLDVFVRDRDADENGVFDEPGGVANVRASVAGDGTQGNGSSSTASIGADGRHVAFQSFAPNLVLGDTNGQLDVFVRDRDADGNGVFDEPGGTATVRISVSSEGIEGDGDSASPQLSADGRFVVFDSLAENLVADDANGTRDVFVRDRDADENGVFDEPGAVATFRASLRDDGAETGGFSLGGALSADGRRVAFASDGADLVPNDTNGRRDLFVADNPLAP